MWAFRHTPPSHSWLNIRVSAETVYPEASIYNELRLWTTDTLPDDLDAPPRQKRSLSYGCQATNAIPAQKKKEEAET